MKILSQNRAIEKLQVIQTDFAERIRSDFEQNAESCLTCKTPGACCLDAHFVNVRITRLEAAAIKETLDKLPSNEREDVYRRIGQTIEKYQLNGPDDSIEKTYACPLFEKNVGCLVHSEAKPLPCIQHACYENEKDLPPGDLLTEQEGRVENLNKLVYGKSPTWLPLPVAIQDRLAD